MRILNDERMRPGTDLIRVWGSELTSQNHRNTGKIPLISFILCVLLF
jgi:hypothetical protein